mgnify:CR=1 FL=1
MKFGGMILLVLLLGCSNSEKELSIIYPSGGYNFIKLGRDTLFTAYPLKNIITRSDSFNVSYYGHYFLKAFNEPNLSLRPSTNSKFRLIYESTVNIYIITLTEETITVKKWVKGSVYPEEDESNLTDFERKYYYIFKKYFFQNKVDQSPFLQNIVDSMKRNDPGFNSLNYYEYLHNKKVTKKPYSTTYSIQITPISKSLFVRLIDTLNSAGYWRMPYQINCNNIPTDAGGFVLEANTGLKYNVVKSIDCPGDSSRYNKACQEIINAAGLKKEIQLIWN